MGYGKIYETTNWGNPVADGWGNIYYDLTQSGAPVGPYGELVVVTLACGEFDNRGTGVSYTYKDISGSTQTGFLGGDGILSPIIMKESELNTIASTDGGQLLAVHGGRRVITQLTNNSGTTSYTPNYWNGLNNGVSENGSIGTLTPLQTWTGEIVALPRPALTFDGDTAVVVFTQSSGEVSIDAETVDLVFTEVYRNY